MEMMLNFNQIYLFQSYCDINHIKTHGKLFTTQTYKLQFNIL